MTKEEVVKLVEAIKSDREVDEVVEEGLKKLVDSFDESVGMEEYEERKNDVDDGKEEIVMGGNGDNLDSILTKAYESVEEWKGKYYDMRDKYAERFFTSGAEVKEEQKENVKEDGKVKTFEELFERREG